MKIQILGTGCAKCKALTQQSEAAVASLDESQRGDYEIEKIEDMDRILSFGVMMTPALALDGEVVSAGKVLAADQIAALLTERNAS